MSSKGNTIWIISVSASILIVVLVLVLRDKNKKIKASKNENKDLKIDRVQLLKDLAENSILPSESKKVLIKIGKEMENSDKKVSEEIKKVLTLINNKMMPEALFKLVKILDNILENSYSETDEYKEWQTKNKEKTNLIYSILNFIKHKKIINHEEFHTVALVKELRNKEAHELNVELSKPEMQFAFNRVISLILKLSKTS